MNQTPLIPGLFITGTDTGVGKTWMSSAIAKCMTDAGYRVGVLKPVATGIINADYSGSDMAQLLENAGWPTDHSMIRLANPIEFEAAAAPTVAARAEGRRLEWTEILKAVRNSIEQWQSHNIDFLLVEGVGGVLCPLAEDGKTVASLMVALDFPTLVVARKGLGTLNHTISTVNQIRNGPTRLAGILLNEVPGDDPAGIPESTAAVELSAQICSTAVLHVARSTKNPAQLADQIRHLNWSTRCLKPRWPLS